MAHQDESIFSHEDLVLLSFSFCFKTTDGLEETSHNYISLPISAASFIEQEVLE